MPTKKQESHYLSEAYEYFKAFKNLLSSSCFCGPNRPTNRTGSYIYLIGCCSVKRKRSGFPLLPPQLFSRRAAQSLTTCRAGGNLKRESHLRHGSNFSKRS